VPLSGVLRDFGDHVLLPGLVDSHVHINEPGRTEWEGFWTATRAAASGGVTMLVDMPLNCIPERSMWRPSKPSASRPRAKHGLTGRHGAALCAANSEALPSLAAAGVPGFKCFLIHSGIDSFAWVNEADLRVALGKLRGTGLPLLAHAEVAGPVETATASLHAAGADWRKYSTYLASRPEAAEIEAIALLIRLAEEFQTHIHIVHLASAKALPLLAEARGRGYRSPWRHASNTSGLPPKKFRMARPNSSARLPSATQPIAKLCGQHWKTARSTWWRRTTRRARRR